MNKRMLLLLPLAVCFLFFIICLPVSAEEGDDTDRLWQDFRNSLPDLVADRLPSTPDSEALSGQISIRALFSLFAESLQGGSTLFLPHFASLLGLVLLASVIELLTEGKNGGGIAACAVTAGAALLIHAFTADGAAALTDMLDDLGTVIGATIPPYVAASVAMGEGALSASSGSLLSSFLVLLELLSAKLLPPIANASFAFVLIDSLGGEVRTDGIARSMRGLFMTLLGIVSFLITSAMALGTSLASASDTAALRLAKYTTAGMIPIVGGTISGLLGQITSSVSLFRSTLGIGSLVAILSLTLPPLLYLLLARFSFSLSAGAAHLFGASRIERLLGEFRSVYDMLLAVGAITTATAMLSLGCLLAGGAG